VNLPNVVARYAQRYAAVHRIGHSVSSPLGAWLALAVAAQAAPEGELRPVNAFQAAVAGYGQYGFEAAAFTGIALGCAFGSPEPARVATLRFGHPYAVVAVMRHARTGDPWHGIPLFAAWVAEPRDPSEVSIGS